MKWGWIEKAIPFWTNASYSRPLILILNLWVGIPYVMLITTGLLMNIPEELYESARIDGAGPFQMFRKTDGAGKTDLLVTWLYKMTINDTNYKMAAVIGIMVFVVTAVVSLVVYNLIPSVRDEEGFQ